MTRKLTEKHLVFASHNRGKIEEIKALFAPLLVKVSSASELSLPEPDETGTSYLENALIKARAATAKTGLPAIGDDSGIELDALVGQPGLHTAPYTKQHGGHDKVFALWATNKAIAQNLGASFVCVQVLLWPDNHYEWFEGIVKGHLTFPPRGHGGHGYDPIFIPNGYNQTVGEMALHEKNTCSHRFIALKKLIAAST